MESLPLNIQQPLELLIYSSVIMLIIISVFLVKLLVDLSNLVKSIQVLSGIVRHEIEPTIKEFRNTMANINTIATNADKQVNNINKTLNSGMNVLSNSTTDFYTRAKIIGSSIREGLFTAIKVFTEQKKAK